MTAIKELPEDDLHFSLDLKVELNFLGKFSTQLSSFMKKLTSQSTYLVEDTTSKFGEGNERAKTIMTDALLEVGLMKGNSGTVATEFDETCIVEQLAFRMDTATKTGNFTLITIPIFEDSSGDILVSKSNVFSGPTNSELVPAHSDHDDEERVGPNKRH